MTGPKTNERPGTRAVLRHAQISPFKVRPVLDLIRGEHVERALQVLQFSERDAAIPVRKLLASAVANAANNDGLDPDELYVSACFADAGPSLRRFRYRARGRATRILKRRSHITVIVSRLGDEELARYRERQSAEQAALRSRRVEAGRRGRRRRDEPEAAEETALAEAEAEVQEEAVEDVAEAGAERAEDEATEPADQESSAAGGETTEEPAEGAAEVADEAEQADAAGVADEAAEDEAETEQQPEEQREEKDS